MKRMKSRKMFGPDDTLVEVSRRDFDQTGSLERWRSALERWSSALERWRSALERTGMEVRSSPSCVNEREAGGEVQLVEVDHPNLCSCLLFVACLHSAPCCVLYFYAFTPR